MHFSNFFFLLKIKNCRFTYLQSNEKKCLQAVTAIVCTFRKLLTVIKTHFLHLDLLILLNDITFNHAVIRSSHKKNFVLASLTFQHHR